MGLVVAHDPDTTQECWERVTGHDTACLVVDAFAVVSPSGGIWRIDAGGPGLGTAGSGDVVAGAITGFAARGLSPEYAAVWGTWCHARAGDRLTERMGLGFLARELAGELPAAVLEMIAPP